MSSYKSPGSVARPAAVAATVAVAVAAAGGLATDIGPWYYALTKPAWQPPDWLFGPVWTLIYTLTASAAVIAWRREQNAAGRRRLLLLFAVNAVLNVLWSVLFFTARRPDWALVEVVPLWLSVLALVIAVRPRSGPAAALLLPYLAWVGFAALLNLSIVRLNGPF